MPLKSFYYKKLVFKNKNVLFEHCRKVRTINILYHSNIFSNFKCSVYLFRAAISKPNFVLHRDRLLHWPLQQLAQVFNKTGNTKEGSITVPLTSCLTGSESAVWQLTFLFLFARQANPNQSYRRSMVQWYFPL